MTLREEAHNLASSFEKFKKSNRSQTSLQRQHFLSTYLDVDTLKSNCLMCQNVPYSAIFILNFYVVKTGSCLACTYRVGDVRGKAQRSRKRIPRESLASWEPNVFPSAQESSYNLGKFSKGATSSSFLYIEFQNITKFSTISFHYWDNLSKAGERNPSLTNTT